MNAMLDAEGWSRPESRALALSVVQSAFRLMAAFLCEREPVADPNQGA